MTTRKSQSKKLTAAKKAAAARNRRIRRDNAAFEAMTPAQKRVQIARDVLAQIATRKFVVRQGNWLSVVDPGGPDEYTDETPMVVDTVDVKGLADTELQTILRKQETCYGCAIGGMFGCAIDRSNKLKLKQLDNFNQAVHNKDSVAILGSDAFRYLRKLFTNDQLNMIEYAFERSEGTVKNHEQSEDLNSAYNFCCDIDDPTLRMRLIMQNIILHDGKFVPTDLPVMTYLMPGFNG